MDLIIYWRFESPGRISDLMLYFHLSHRPYKCTPLNPRYARWQLFAERKQRGVVYSAVLRSTGARIRLCLTPLLHEGGLRLSPKP